MPDQWGFSHEPHRGIVYHRCVECSQYPWGEIVPIEERKRHHAMHERERLQRIERERRRNLKEARKRKGQVRKENDLAYGGESTIVD